MSSHPIHPACYFKIGSLQRKIGALPWRQLSDIPTEPLLNLYSPTFVIQQDFLIIESRHYLQIGLVQRHHHRF